MTDTKKPNLSRKRLAQALLNEFSLATLQQHRESLRQGISLSTGAQYRLLKIVEALAAELS